MRIGLVGDVPPPSGGIAMHVAALASALGDAGHDVEVIDISRVSPAQLASRAAWLVARGFTLHLHTSGHNPKSWALAAACGWVRGARGNAVTLHSGLLPGWLVGMPERQRAARLALRPYGRVVAVSGQGVDALVEAGIDRARILEQPAFLASQVRPGSAPLELGKLRGRPMLCAAVASSPIYGARVLAAAIPLLRRELPELMCAVFGPGSQSLTADGIVGLGELTHADALAVIAASDALLRPTLTDGDALSVREALALGVRVVASDAVPRPKGVHTFRTGDPFALADAVKLALSQGRPPASADDALPALIEMYRELSGERRAA